MTEITREWVDKAEADFHSAQLVLQPPSGSPNLDLVCFLSQQCVEKYLKGVLQAHDIEFSKTHNLTHLLDLVLPMQPLWESWRSAFRLLTEYAVEFRYPGEWADSTKAKKALSVASAFRSEAREVFGLPTS